jgi:hypothetical protein
MLIAPIPASEAFLCATTIFIVVTFGSRVIVSLESLLTAFGRYSDEEICKTSLRINQCKA